MQGLWAIDNGPDIVGFFILQRKEDRAAPVGFLPPSLDQTVVNDAAAAALSSRSPPACRAHRWHRHRERSVPIKVMGDHHTVLSSGEREDHVADTREALPAIVA